MTTEIVPGQPPSPREAWPAGGPTREEAQELNRPKSVQGDPLNKVKRVANVLAATLTVAAGTGLAATAQEALKSTLPSIVQKAPEQDPLNRKPPEGVVFPQSPRADAPFDSAQGRPAEPVLTKRVFIPSVTKEYRENPYLTREFGAPERGVIMRNKVEQGGSPVYVEMGDQELFENMMYLRERWGRPDLKLEITFYSTVDLLLRDLQAPPWRTENLRGVLNYDSWAGGNGTFQNGSVLFRYTESTKTLQFYITLPETYRGKIPTESEVKQIHADFVRYLRGYVFLTREDGRSNLSLEQWNDPTVYQDLVTHLVVVQDSTRKVTNSSVWIKLETIPTTGGK